MILATGVTGHVGHAVISRLAPLGHDVVAMVGDVQAASRRLPSRSALRVAKYENASGFFSLLLDVADFFPQYLLSGKNTPFASMINKS